MLQQISIDLQQFAQLINQNRWVELSYLLDEILNKSKKTKISQDDNQQKYQQHFLTSTCFSQTKKTILNMIINKFQVGNYNLISYEDDSNKGQAIDRQQLEEILLKILISKGLIINEFNYRKDIQLIIHLLENSSNLKYLFMIYQQASFQLKQAYPKVSFGQAFDEIVEIKILSINKAFLRLLSLNIFEDIINKYDQYFEVANKLSQENNIIQQSKENSQLKSFKQFNQWFNNQTINKLSQLISISNVSSGKFIETFREKPIVLNNFFRFIKLLYNQNYSLSINHFHQQLLKIISVLIKRVEISFIQIIKKYSQFPSFWISFNLNQLQLIYSEQLIFDILGQCLIKQLPSRPEFTKIKNYLFILVQWVCTKIFIQVKPLQSFKSALTSDSSSQFYISLFQKFAILLGIMSVSKPQQNQILMMINSIFNKSNLFASPVLHQLLWHRLSLSHLDQMNFRNFCLGQYKKVFNQTNIKDKQVIQILRQSTQLMKTLINELEGNSHPDKIGFYITLTIYYLGFLRRTSELYKTQNQVSSNLNDKFTCINLLFNFFFKQKIKDLRVQIKQKFDKLKESLKDRLEVAKMKQTNNQNIIRENNEISICIFRIEQDLKFN